MTNFPSWTADADAVADVDADALLQNPAVAAKQLQAADATKVVAVDVAVDVQRNPAVVAKQLQAADVTPAARLNPAADANRTAVVSFAAASCVDWLAVLVPNCLAVADADARLNPAVAAMQLQAVAAACRPNPAAVATK